MKRSTWWFVALAYGISWSVSEIGFRLLPQGKYTPMLIAIAFMFGPALAAGLNPPLAAGNVVQNALIAWLAEVGVAADRTEDVTRLSNLNQYKAVFAHATDKRSLSDALDGADVFVGLSGANLLSQEDLKRMAPNPIVFACSNPDPEIKPELAREANPIRWLGGGVGEEGPNIGLDPLVAQGTNAGDSPTPFLTFEGVPSISGVTPPDTNGDVGPNHYIQMTNFHFRIWDKGDPENGVPPSPLTASIALGTFFAPLGGGCQSNFGDPYVMYDDLADRWVLTQFDLSGTLGMCFAVSPSSTWRSPSGSASIWPWRSTGGKWPSMGDRTACAIGRFSNRR